LGEFSGILSKSYAPHCRVLSPGEINVTIPEPRATEPGATLQGAAI